MASGHDDGSWGVWDLRNFNAQTTPSPVAHYDFHKSAITSISFNPLDESIIAVSSEDNTVTLWDLAVEADDEEITEQRKELQELHNIHHNYYLSIGREMLRMSDGTSKSLVV